MISGLKTKEKLRFQIAFDFIRNALHIPKTIYVNEHSIFHSELILVEKTLFRKRSVTSSIVSKSQTNSFRPFVVLTGC